MVIVSLECVYILKYDLNSFSQRMVMYHLSLLWNGHSGGGLPP